MYLGQTPEPGTPEFGQMAAARRAALLGLPAPVFASPSDVYGPPSPFSDPGPGTPAFGARAAQRRATIAATPIPQTSGPPLLFLPTKYAAEGVEAAAGAATRGLFSGVGPVVLIGAGLALYFLVLRPRRG